MLSVCLSVSLSFFSVVLSVLSLSFSPFFHLSLHLSTSSPLHGWLCEISLPLIAVYAAILYWRGARRWLGTGAWWWWHEGGREWGKRGRRRAWFIHWLCRLDPAEPSGKMCVPPSRERVWLPWNGGERKGRRERDVHSECSFLQFHPFPLSLPLPPFFLPFSFTHFVFTVWFCRFLSWPNRRRVRALDHKLRPTVQCLSKGPKPRPHPKPPHLPSEQPAKKAFS